MKIAALLWIALVGLAHAADPAPLDGPGRINNDALLDKLVGSWKLEGQMLGKPLVHTVKAEWVLNHQFVRFHERDTQPGTPNDPPYEAMVFLGLDNLSERYVAHWLDNFGGRTSLTLGFAPLDQKQLAFVFEYPDGPFRTTFAWDEASKGWNVVMRSKDKTTGTWGDFITARLIKSGAKP